MENQKSLPPARPLPTQPREAEPEFPINYAVDFTGELPDEEYFTNWEEDWEEFENASREELEYSVFDKVKRESGQEEYQRFLDYLETHQDALTDIDQLSEDLGISIGRIKYFRMRAGRECSQGKMARPAWMKSKAPRRKKTNVEKHRISGRDAEQKKPAPKKPTATTKKPARPLDQWESAIKRAYEAGNLITHIHTVIKRQNDGSPCRSWSYANQVYLAIKGHVDARGYRQWQDAGRQVKKGEKAIKILGGKGREIPVFGVSQTDGRPLASVPETNISLSDVNTAMEQQDWHKPRKAIKAVFQELVEQIDERATA